MSVESILQLVTFGSGLAITTVLAWGDLRHRCIGNRGVLQLVFVAVCGLGLTVLVGERGAQSLGAMALGSIAFASPLLAVRLVSGGGLGWGDIKLAGALGLYLGWLGPLVALSALVGTSSVLALSLAAAKLEARRRAGTPSSPTARPMAPALALGAVAAGLGTGL